MDVSLLIRHRLKELGLGQRDLAAAAEVTESYISQLLARKKVPPSPGRTGIYEKIGKVLKLPRGELSRLAELQRREELRKKVAEPPGPLFKECRELVQFLKDRTLSGDVSVEEVEFLMALRFRGRQPMPIYYYRELQSAGFASFSPCAATRGIGLTAIAG